MSVQLDITVGRPWAFAFALALRDAMDVPAADAPRTGFGNAHPECSDQADAWRRWWDSLLARGASNRGFAKLNDVRSVEDLASVGAPRFGVATSLIAEAAAWATSRAFVAGEMSVPSSRPSPVIEGIVAAGFQTPSGRRQARRRLGRALPNDVVVAVVPVIGEWGRVTKFGSILVSESVASHAELTRQYFAQSLWAA